MTEQELQALVEQVSLQTFHRPFNHWVKINSRLRTTGGRYLLSDHHLEFNAHYLVPEQRMALIGIIKHELCHYHLHCSGQPYEHRSQAFKTLLAQVGGSRYAPALGLYHPQMRRYHYQCLSCGCHYDRVRRINTRRYSCGRCHGHLQLLRRPQSA